MRSTGAPATASAGPPRRRRSQRGELVVLGLAALVIRVGYVLAYKHPVSIGGDAYWYHYGANLLVDGHGFIDAYRYKIGIVAQTADHPPGTILVLAAASLAGMRSFFWHQLEMGLLGSLTVVVIAVTARKLAGRRAGIIAGVIAIVYPNLWFNDALVMSETLIQLTTALAVLAAFAWWSAPSRRRAALLGVAVAGCALSRAEAALFIPFLVAPLILLDRRLAWRRRLAQAALGAGVAAVVVAPWVGFNLSRFEQPVTISTGFDPTAAVSNCDAVYYGPLTGYWYRPCILNLPPPPKGDVSTQEAFDRKEAFKYIRAHETRVPTVVADRVLRTFALFRPIQQIQLDRIETRELGFSEVGLGMYYALAAGTIVSIFLLRRRRIPVSPILATVAVVVVATAVTFGQTRYRASAEVVLVLGGAIALSALIDRLRRSGPPGEATVVEERPVPEPATIGVSGETSRRSRTGHFPCFDGLRALAAVSVVLVHTAFPSGFSTSNRLGAYTSRLEIGVAVFFAISGFLLYRPFVAAHLAGRPGPAVGPYLTRRFLRIVPAYWAALLVAAYVLHAITPPLHDAKAIVVYFGFLQIYFSHYILGGISAAWTLCVEVTFYLFLPVYAALIDGWSRRRGTGRLPAELAGLAGLVAVSLAYKVAVFARPSGQQTGAGTWLPAQLDLFALGMALAVASVWWSEHGHEPALLARRWMPGASWAVSSVLFWVVSAHAGLPRVPVYLATLAQTVSRQWLYGAFAFFFLLPAVFGPPDRGWIRRGLRSRPMVAIGSVSYGIYLWHETWMRRVLQWLHRPLFTMSFVKLTLAVAALSGASAVVSLVLVEQPSQRLGRRRLGRHGTASTTAATTKEPAGAGV